jgi:hypothetical protein
MNDLYILVNINTKWWHSWTKPGAEAYPLKLE